MSFGGVQPWGGQCKGKKDEWGHGKKKDWGYGKKEKHQKKHEKKSKSCH